jgi:hypothetical protein
MEENESQRMQKREMASVHNKRARGAWRRKPICAPSDCSSLAFTRHFQFSQMIKASSVTTNAHDQGFHTQISTAHDTELKSGICLWIVSVAFFSSDIGGVERSPQPRKQI